MKASKTTRDDATSDRYPLAGIFNPIDNIGTRTEPDRYNTRRNVCFMSNVHIVSYTETGYGSQHRSRKLTIDSRDYNNNSS